jgi:hypothetical protein
MARDLAAELEALEAAIARGVLVYRYQDRYEEFRSLDDMIRIRDGLRRQLGIPTAAFGARDVLVEYNKGIRPGIRESAGGNWQGWVP